MKKTYLLLSLLVFSLSVAKTTTAPPKAINPSIGVTLQSMSTGGPVIDFTIAVKNTGEETLTHIYISHDADIYIYGATVEGDTISSIAPGEEIYYAFYGQKQATCYDISQVTVHATSSTLGEITHLSSSYPQDYYGSQPTETFQYDYLLGPQDGTYVDLNGNSIVDVGDVVTYTYDVNGYIYNFQIIDDNAIVTNPNGYGSYQTTGVHYITAADVTEGYVYNSTTMVVFDSCTGSGNFYDPTPCNNCPSPSTCSNCIVTQLTTGLPNKISGDVKFNINNDNCATGLPFPIRKVSTTNGSNTYASYTGNDGSYSILIPTNGDFQTSALNDLGSNFSSNPASVSVTSSGTNSNYSNTDFCIASSTNYGDLQVAIVPIDHPRPGFTANYKLYFTNIGSTNLNGTIAFTFDNSKMTYNSSVPGVNSTALNTIIFNFNNLLPFEYRVITLTLNVLPPPTTNTADVLDFTLVGDPIVGEANPGDNTFTMQQTVVSSFDPNDKTVTEGAYIGLDQADDYLHYVTRFQNTGTASATTVVLKEMLDPKLDWDTFEPIGASHNYNVQIINGNDVTVTFSNINLPDSTADEPGSHGWMAYRIKPKADIVVNDIMSSHSDIYFDFNPPVITNTVTTQLTSLSAQQFSKNNFVIYPNPASKYISIESSAGAEFEYRISDINGKILLNGTSQNGSEIDVSPLQNGFYFLSVNNQAGTSVQKFIKN
jgi:hypothetical protein